MRGVTDRDGSILTALVEQPVEDFTDLYRIDLRPAKRGKWTATIMSRGLIGWTEPPHWTKPTRDEALAAAKSWCESDYYARQAPAQQEVVEYNPAEWDAHRYDD